MSDHKWVALSGLGQVAKNWRLGGELLFSVENKVPGRMSLKPKKKYLGSFELIMCANRCDICSVSCFFFVFQFPSAENTSTDKTMMRYSE